MTQEGFKRKLTAILSADVVGYSRLMEDNEEATIQTLNTYHDLMSTLVKQHRGRVVDTTGDNLMAEFSSVVDAVKCAVETQKEMNERNAALPENRRMLFRIGVNLGDIIEEEDRIYGDGVNIAARLEGLAEAGGICISRTAYDQVKKKLELGYEYLGEHSVKNLSEPVHVFRVLMEPEAVGKVIGEKRKEKRRMTLAVVIVLLIGLGGLAGWYLYIEQTKRIEPASVEKMAFPLPDRPSIAVLPFTNMSADPEQEYFSDGMTDDLITDLSKISGLFVIARNSTFTYKGKSVKIWQVAEDLGVRYVLEGSIRKVDNRVRINAQLIDATTGQHLWANRYDGTLGDVFELQDEINQKIVSALVVKLTADEKEQVARKDTDNISAYEAFLKGREYYYRWTREDWVKAESYFKKAIDLDAHYGKAYAALGLLYFGNIRNRWGLWGYESEAWELTKKTLQIAMNYPTSSAHLLASQISLEYREYEKAIAEAERAITIDPNEPDSHVQMAKALVFVGRPGEAFAFVKRAMRLDPHYPAYYQFVLGLAHFAVGELIEAVPLFERTHRRNPEFKLCLVPLAATYAHLGRIQEAKEAFYKYRPAGAPTFDTIMFHWPFKDQEVADRFAEGLRKAGIQ